MARILVVDDDRAVLEITSELLAACGHRVLATGSPERALRALEGGEVVDLLVTDVRMPVLTGPQLAAHARELLPGLSVLFMSGADTVAPGEAFIAKPFTLERLLDAVHGLLRGRGLDAPVGHTLGIRHLTPALL
ncbi:MAG: response regulator [Myxococcota bacterium]